MGLIAWLLAGLFGDLSSAVQAADDGPNVRAQSAIVVDATTGGILFGKNIHRRAAMASTTKIMTALTALATPGTNLTEPYKVVKDDLVGEASMGLKEGEVVSFQDLLYGMLLNSGNDAAMAIARYAGSKLSGQADPVARFVAYMNQFAPTLGLRNSHYANPHGLDQTDHYSSAFDLAITGWYALKNPVLSKIIATSSATVANHNLTTLNPLLLNHYAGANGVKPGFTDNAGLCLVGSATRNGQTVIMVIMGDDNTGYRSEPAALLDYGFAQLKSPQIQQTLQQGATGATAADYIGRPDGNRLIPFGGTNAATGPNIINIGPDGSIIQAQISQDQTTPNPTVTTQTDTGGGNGPDSTANKDKGGLNFFTLLFIILIGLGILYCVLRFTPAGGDRGKEIAYKMEDLALSGWELLRNGVQKLWHFVRPGNHEEESSTTTTTTNRRPPPSLAASSEADRNRRIQNLTDRTQAGRPTQPGNNYTSPATDTRTSPTARPRPASIPGDQTTTNFPPNVRPGQNPLENIFDDIEPFAFEEESGLPQPPRPLTNKPVEPPVIERPAERPIERLAERPPTRPAERPFVRPPMINPTPAQPPTPLNPTAASRPVEPGRPAANEPRPSVRPLSQPQTSETAMTRARQAIDYAYAGRLTASTEEFRRVVDLDPLFDFGSIDEFEQMPVLGFKALANAYREVNRSKFAILLLDMAIERYPNDLELRNLQRSLRRE